MNCIVCGSSEFRNLPSPYGHSMTTTGRIIPEPLSKAQCMQCSLVRRVNTRLLGETTFYEKEYSFYSRPGAEQYDRPRYLAMAQWIQGALPGFTPQSVLDAGCGRGWMLRVLREVYPDAVMHGVEPSEDNSAAARAMGFDVSTGRIDAAWNPARTYDLIYSTNVIEHVLDPGEFLGKLASCLTPEGCLVVTCPDATHPNAEIMFSDQNFSFTPQSLALLGRSVGLEVLCWKQAPEVNSLRDKQLIVLGRSLSRFPTDVWPSASPEDFFAKRQTYIQSYVACDDHLTASVVGHTLVANFGTSSWSWLLAAYCPNYWKRVDFCTIHNGSGEFLGKPVKDFTTLDKNPGLVVVLGVNPFNQTGMARMMEEHQLPCVRWDHIVPR